MITFFFTAFSFRWIFSPLDALKKKFIRSSGKKNNSPLPRARWKRTPPRFTAFTAKRCKKHAVKIFFSTHFTAFTKIHPQTSTWVDQPLIACSSPKFSLIVLTYEKAPQAKLHSRANVPVYFRSFYNRKWILDPCLRTRVEEFVKMYVKNALTIAEKKSIFQRINLTY